MMRVLGLILLMASLAFGQERGVMIDENSVLLGRGTNLFKANSNLLNQAVSSVGAGVTAEDFAAATNNLQQNIDAISGGGISPGLSNAYNQTGIAATNAQNAVSTAGVTATNALGVAGTSGTTATNALGVAGTSGTTATNALGIAGTSGITATNAMKSTNGVAQTPTLNNATNTGGVTVRGNQNNYGGALFYTDGTGASWSNAFQIDDSGPRVWGYRDNTNFMSAHWYIQFGEAIFESRHGGTAAALPLRIRSDAAVVIENASFTSGNAAGLTNVVGLKTGEIVCTYEPTNFVLYATNGISQRVFATNNINVTNVVGSGVLSLDIFPGGAPRLVTVPTNCPAVQTNGWVLSGPYWSRWVTNHGMMSFANYGTELTNTTWGGTAW